MSDDLTPGTVVGRDFRIVRLIARGGMGAVYEAEQLSTGARRALKVMLASTAANPRMRTRFADEARASARIGSRHVVEVIGAGVDEDTGTPWLAMEYLEGQSLADAVRSRGRLDASGCWQVMAQVYEALAAAHAAGIVHRDIKPENIFVVTSPSGAVSVRVLDFGIAKWLADDPQEGRRHTQALGTLHWAAPEQLNGEEVGPATDLWAAGLLAFYLLTGHSYWLAVHAPALSLSGLIGEVNSATRERASARARKFQPEIRLTPGFDAWFAQCTAVAPADRFRSAGEACSALGRALESPARIASKGSRAWKWAAAAAIIALGGGGIALAMNGFAGVNWPFTPETRTSSETLPSQTSSSTSVMTSVLPTPATGVVLAPAPDLAPARAACRFHLHESVHLRAEPICNHVPGRDPEISADNELEVLSGTSVPCPQYPGQYVYRVRVVRDRRIGFVHLLPSDVPNCSL